MLYDNPTDRLKTILDAGSKADKNQQCFIIWSSILNVPNSEIGETLYRIGKVMNLSREIVSLLQIYYPHQVESSTLWRSQIENAFLHQQINGKWESFINHISPHCVAHLSFIADMLHAKLNLQLTPDEKIAELVEKLNMLISEIENNNLANEIKIYLLRELSALIQTLREYKITGVEAALNQVKSMVGHAYRDTQYRNFLNDHKIGQRVLDNRHYQKLKSMI